MILISSRMWLCKHRLDGCAITNATALQNGLISKIVQAICGTVVLLFWTWFITLNYAAYNISRLWESFITACRLHFLNNRCLFIAFCNALDDLGIFFSARCALTSRLRYSSGFNPGNCQHGVINYVHNNNDLMPDQLRMCDFKCSMDSA